MGTPNPQELAIRGMRAHAQLYGQIVAAGKLSISSSTVAVTQASLPAGLYVLTADAQDVCFADGVLASAAAIATDGTCPMLPGGSQIAVWLGGKPGTTFTLSVLLKTGSTAGVVWWQRMDDVG